MPDEKDIQQSETDSDATDGTSTPSDSGLHEIEWPEPFPGDPNIKAETIIDDTDDE